MRTRTAPAGQPQGGSSDAPTRVLVGVTADSLPSTVARVIASAAHLRTSAPAVHARWAVCVWDGHATAWRVAARAHRFKLYASSSTARTDQSRAPGRVPKLSLQLLLLPSLRAAWYDALWLLDADIDLASGFDAAAFWSLWRTGLGSAGPPLVSQPLIARGDGQFYWPLNNASFGSRAPLAALRGEALRVRFVEQQAAVLVPSFFCWLVDQLAERLLGLQAMHANISYGIDLLWCAAAEAYACRAEPRQEQAPVACALLAVEVVHADTRSLHKDERFFQQGMALLRRVQSAWPRWFVHPSKFLWMRRQQSLWLREAGVTNTSIETTDGSVARRLRFCLACINITGCGAQAANQRYAQRV